MTDWNLTIDLRFSMHLYMYMGKYAPKKGKNRRKVTSQFQSHQILTTLHSII